MIASKIVLSFLISNLWQRSSITGRVFRKSDATGGLCPQPGSRSLHTGHGSLEAILRSKTPRLTAHSHGRIFSLFSHAHLFNCALPCPFLIIFPLPTHTKCLCGVSISRIRPQRSSPNHPASPSSIVSLTLRSPSHPQTHQALITQT